MTRWHVHRGAALTALVCLLAGLALVPLPAVANASLDALSARIESYARAHVDGDVSSITVPPLGDFRLDGVDPASLRVDLSARTSRARSRTVPIAVVISNGERVLKRGVVNVGVVRIGPVVVAARALEKGTVLTAGDLRVERRDLASIPESAASRKDLVIGMATTRSISPGRFVRVDQVERPAVIDRGQRVRLVLHVSNLRIEGVGHALSNGAVGDVVRVRNADSRREVQGRVSADGAVHVGY